MDNYGGYGGGGGYGGYSTTSYGAQGGAGGGGFIPGEGSQSSPSGNKGYGKDTLRPVTIKQINDAKSAVQDGDFSIDGAEITQITLVGQIRNISTQTTNITYKLDDGTGTLEVKQWIDSDAMSSESGTKPKLVENSYARVWGKLKQFNNKRHVIAQMIRPITDYNEISYHLLEATVIHLHFTKGPLDANKQSANAGGNQQQQSAGGYGGAQDGGADRSLASLSASAKKVLACLKNSPQSNEGLHLQDIAQRLSMDTADVAKAGDDLLSMGMIYTTVDDSTWVFLDM